MRKLNNEMQAGFTMVELSLSLAFIAVLSIIVVIVIGNAVSAYHRGITLNQLNTTGMDVVEEMRATLHGSPARSAKQECESYTDSTAKKNCEKNGGLSLIYKERLADIQIGKNGYSSSVPIYGVFCTGEYSYLWNAGYFFNTNDYKITGGASGPLDVRYLMDGDNDDRPWSERHGSSLKLLKVQDRNRDVCKQAAGANYSGEMTNSINLTSYTLDEEPVELLEGSSNLAIYSLTTAIPAESGAGNMLYAVSFILGTVQGGVNVTGVGNYCASPEDYGSADVENFDYCAINKFNFAAQATGGRK